MVATVALIAVAAPPAAAAPEWNYGLPEVEGASALEIGAGQGCLAAQLAAAGAQRVVAADFSAEAVAKTRHVVESRGLGNVTVDRADIHALPYAADLFDVVVACETLEHVRDPGTAVRELARVLRPGGWLFLTVPNYLNLFALQRMYRRIVGRPYTEGGQPRNNFTTLPHVLLWVRGAGLQRTMIDGLGIHVPIPRDSGAVELRLPDWLARRLRWFASDS